MYFACPIPQEVVQATQTTRIKYWELNGVNSPDILSIFLTHSNVDKSFKKKLTSILCLLMNCVLTITLQITEWLWRIVMHVSSPYSKSRQRSTHWARRPTLKSSHSMALTLCHHVLIKVVHNQSKRIGRKATLFDEDEPEWISTSCVLGRQVFWQPSHSATVWVGVIIPKNEVCKNDITSCSNNDEHRTKCPFLVCTILSSLSSDCIHPLYSDVGLGVGDSRFINVQDAIRWDMVSLVKRVVLTVWSIRWLPLASLCWLSSSIVASPCVQPNTCGALPWSCDTTHDRLSRHTHPLQRLGSALYMPQPLWMCNTPRMKAIRVLVDLWVLGVRGVELVWSHWPSSLGSKHKPVHPWWTICLARLALQLSLLPCHLPQVVTKRQDVAMDFPLFFQVGRCCGFTVGVLAVGMLVVVVRCVVCFVSILLTHSFNNCNVIHTGRNSGFQFHNSSFWGMDSQCLILHDWGMWE